MLDFRPPHHLPTIPHRYRPYSAPGLGCLRSVRVQRGGLQQLRGSGATANSAATPGVGGRVHGRSHVDGRGRWARRYAPPGRRPRTLALLAHLAATSPRRHTPPLLAGCGWLRSWDAPPQPAACASAREHCMRCLRRSALASAAAAIWRRCVCPRNELCTTQTVSGSSGFWLCNTSVWQPGFFFRGWLPRIWGSITQTLVKNDGRHVDRARPTSNKPWNTHPHSSNGTTARCPCSRGLNIPQRRRSRRVPP